ncbi:hypothetical protein [Marinagarivorans cellulosilyticus]|uniref:Uncharacterized protein n=1 Tax=Marinagarivorans cellulosilyticus TaxID=2721545 RepID=A0AAN1WK28_9GAMM|nr:hypothetical protein [Marinagarivorans cellulosilyticus]BCD99024.1 hypothetical protein MARGE09_P3225 [Marinagarivorans cellulosilyticus]
MLIISSTGYRLIQAIPLSYFLLQLRFDRPSNMYDWTQPYAIASTLALLVSAAVMLRKQNYSPIFVGINIYFVFGWVALAAHWDSINRLYGTLEGAGMMLWILAVVAIGNAICPRWSLGITQQQAKLAKSKEHWKHHAWRLFGFYLLCALLTLVIINSTKSIILREFLPFIVLFLGTVMIQHIALNH